MLCEWCHMLFFFTLLLVWEVCMTITMFFFVCVCSHQKEPELVHGNEELWTFVIYAGEDHTNTQTLVAFLGLLSTLVCIMVTALFVFFIFFCDWTIGPVRPPLKLVLPKSMSCFREKFIAQLGGALCLIAYLSMRRSLKNLFNLLQAYYLIFLRGMHRHLLLI